MNKEEKIEISVNQEDVQNIIDCYEKDIKYIKQLEKENGSLMNALVTTRTKHNNDKARYRRKAKRYRHKWNELQDYFKKQTIDLEMKKEDMSADYYVDRKMFLKEVLSKMQEIEGGVEK